MEQITITAKIQIDVDASSKILLDDTMSAYRVACNHVSRYIFETHCLKQAELHKALYYDLRNMFGMKSQMTQSVIKTVIAKYKSIKSNGQPWCKPVFKKPQYDLVWNRDYSLTNNLFSVNTLRGRVKLPYHSGYMSKYFDHSVYKFGTAKLVSKHGKYYLHIPVSYDVEECHSEDICNVIGIDRGINFVIASYDSKHHSGFVSGKQIKQVRAHYIKLRKELQKRGTSSARRRLKAIGSRENRWMQDVNHCITKALVAEIPKHTLFVLEDLTGIRSVTERVRLKQRYVSVSWSFYDLEQKLIYKAKQNQCSVIKVDPHYTSQCCPACGHIEKSNRNKKTHMFCCKACGYKSNDDRIAAMNLYHMGITYLKDKQVPGMVITE